MIQIKLVLIPFIILITFVFSSCAFHKKFPFICFASACVKEQFKVREIKTISKRIKAKANLRKRKRNSDSDKIVKSGDEINNFSEPKLDTSKTEPLINYSWIKQDTLITIPFESKIDSLSKEDKFFIKQYINRIAVSKVIDIFIQDFHSLTNEDGNKRTVILKNYFLYLGVPKEKIIVKRSKENEYNKVEILIH